MSGQAERIIGIPVLNAKIASGSRCENKRNTNAGYIRFSSLLKKPWKPSFIACRFFDKTYSGPPLKKKNKNEQIEDQLSLFN